MSSTLQNRLVGTIIVVALVVILVPEFLDGEKRINKQEFENVPPVAELVQVQSTERFDSSEVEQELNQPVELVNDLPVDDEIPEDAAQTASAPNTNSSEINETNESTIEGLEEQLPSEDDLSDIVIKDSGWVVQLGSFKHEKNVKELLNTLNNAGYRAYSRPVMTSVGELTKVFVGPELDKNKLELALPHLTEITKLKGKITAFEVSAG
jgi:DedD protein